MTVAEQINSYLQYGFGAESRAVGRFGQIEEVKDGMVVVRSLKDGQRGVTTFDRGDPVMVVPCNRDKMVYVFNG